MKIKYITKIMMVLTVFGGAAILEKTGNIQLLDSVTTSNNLQDQQYSEKQRYIVTALKSADMHELRTVLSELNVDMSDSKTFPLINAVVVSLSDEHLQSLSNFSQFSVIKNKTLTLANCEPRLGFGSRIRQKASTTSNLINASPLHEYGLRGNDITIAVLDTGMRSFRALRKNTHSVTRNYGTYDVSTDVLSQVTGDENGHGTHVASVAVNSEKDLQGRYFGMAPDANLISVKAFDDQGVGSYADVIEGIEWLINHKAEYNIRVLNLSFSAPATTQYWRDPLNRMVMKAWEAGIVVVASAGNTGPEYHSIGVPGNNPYVITVGAMTDAFTPDDTSDDYIPEFSSQGPTYEGFVKPEVIAPGGHILGLMGLQSELAASYPEFHTGYRYFEMSGTSQSSAVVSGAAALLLQSDPQLTPDQVKCRLLSSASSALTDQENLAYSIFRQGAGLIDVQAAVNSTHLNCANQGMDITADLSGEKHYYGPADIDENGNYFVHGLENLEWSGEHEAENAGGFLWRTAFLADGGFLWRTNLASDGGFLWRTNYVATSGGFLWRTSSATAASQSITINSWVDQH